MSTPDDDDERTVAWAGPDSDDDDEVSQGDVPAPVDPRAGEDRT